MELHWIDVKDLSFNTLLLLERVQLSWFPGWVPEAELAIALSGNPTVEWYMRHKCPEISTWLDKLTLARSADSAPSPGRIRQAEIKILDTINDLVVYIVDPSKYDEQPFMAWDSDELRNVTDFAGKTVIDIGSGTGRLAFVAAENAAAVFAVEPVGNLRVYIKQKAHAQNIRNIFPVDGLITDLPFPDSFADITMGGHVYGDTPEASYNEMKRVTMPGGMIILCPGTSLPEVKAHEYLVSQGFHWSTFEEPQYGTKRKYWKVIDQ
jgi:SAM-dependent methyltransferase